MKSEFRSNFKPGSQVWVWDSTWLPGVVVRRPRPDGLCVRLEHGVTFSVDIANLVTRDPARNGNDLPRSLWSQQSKRAYGHDIDHDPRPIALQGPVRS